MKLVLPDALVERARLFASGSSTPAEPRNAATVVLARPGPNEIEVYLLKRQASMAFAANACVFPGGGVDERDFETKTPWAGPTVAEWAPRLGVDPSLAQALVCAAVRETFEESGVLLAGPSTDAVVSDTTSESWEADRVALVNRDVSFSRFLQSRGLVLRSDLLVPMSGWLTPTFESRRYRTWFFLAGLPEGQRTRDVSSESSSVEWIPAQRVVAQVENSQVVMLPPTYLTCLQVAQYASPIEAADHVREQAVTMFMPEVIADGDHYTMSRPYWADVLLAQRG